MAEQRLELTRLAESMGLMAPPRIRFLSANGKPKTEGKNWAAGTAERKTGLDGAEDVDDSYCAS